MNEKDTQENIQQVASVGEESKSFSDKLSLFLAGFQLSDITTTKNHSDDFKDTRGAFIVRRLKLMSVVFAVLILLSSVFDLLLLSSEQAKQMFFARVLLSSLLLLIAFACHRHNRIFVLKYLMPLGFVLPIGFYVFSQVLLGASSHSLEVAGYSYFPYLVIGMLALFPLTLLQSLFIISVIFVPFILVEPLLGDYTALALVNKIWAFVMFACVTLWLQSGQLVMLLKLYRESTLDPLTGLINRRVLMKRLNKEIEHQHAFHILMFDLDKFKKINDTYGHLDGDLVLKTMANILKGAIKPHDIIARFGGEEFVAVLSNSTDEQAQDTAEQIRSACEQCFITNRDDVIIKVTTSIGVTPHKLGDNIDDTFNRADELLYKAKSAGRNQVCFAL